MGACNTGCTMGEKWEMGYTQGADNRTLYKAASRIMC